MTNQYILARITGRDPNLRASDADRERVADRLRKGHAEGRLDMSEFQERLERCYDAKTFGQLGELVRDLPREVEPERHSSLAWLRALPLVPLVPILLVLFALTALSGDEHHVLVAVDTNRVHRLEDVLVAPEALVGPATRNRRLALTLPPRWRSSPNRCPCHPTGAEP